MSSHCTTEAEKIKSHVRGKHKTAHPVNSTVVLQVISEEESNNCV